MLKRKSPDLVEFRALELALSRIAPAHLSDDRRLALFERVMASLPAQELTTADRVRALAQARWVAIPVGAGVAAAIIAGTTIWAAYLDHDDGEVALQKPRFKGPSGYVDEGQLVRVSESTWFNYGEDVSLGLDAGSEAVFTSRDSGVEVSLRSGSISLVSTGTPVYLSGSNWSATVGAHAGGRFELLTGVLRVEAVTGIVSVRVNGRETRIGEDDGTVDLALAGGPGTPPEETPFTGDPGSAVPGPTNGAGAPSDPPQPDGNATGHETAPGQQPGHEALPAAPGNGQSSPPSNPGNSPSNPPTGPGNNNGQGTPPSDPGNGNGPPADPGNESPPANPGNGNGNGNGSPPADPGAGNGNGSPPENQGGNGNGSPPGVPADGNGNGGSNGNGNANGNGNGSPPENQGGNGNGSPPGVPAEGNGNGGSNGNGNANGSGNSNGNGNAVASLGDETEPGTGIATSAPNGNAGGNGKAGQNGKANGLNKAVGFRA